MTILYITAHYAQQGVTRFFIVHDDSEAVRSLAARSGGGAVVLDVSRLIPQVHASEPDIEWLADTVRAWLSSSALPTAPRGCADSFATRPRNVLEENRGVVASRSFHREWPHEACMSVVAVTVDS